MNNTRVLLLFLIIGSLGCLHAQDTSVMVGVPAYKFDAKLTDSIVKPTLSMPESQYSIGLSVGYSQFFLSGNLNLNTYSSKYLYDDKNDIFEFDRESNYKLGLLFNYYLDANRQFALSITASYLTRHGTLTAYPKYLVRDLATMDTAFLFTKSVINTKFNALGLDLSCYYRINVGEDLHILVGLGPNFSMITDTRKSDYTSTILGLENPDKTYRGTDITYKNGSKTSTFDNEQEKDLGNVVESNSFNIGIHANIGIDWALKKDLALRIEYSFQIEPTDYFKNQTLGSVLSNYFTIGILYSGLF